MNIFDHSLYRLRQKRAVNTFYKVDFLVERLLMDVVERLRDVNRSFERVLIVGTRVDQGFITFLKDEKSAQHIDIVSFVGAPEHLEQSGDIHFLNFSQNKEILDITPQSYDLVLDAGTLHQINALPEMLVQMRFALKPDGLFLGVMAGGQTLHGLHECFVRAETEIYGGASARIHPFASLQSLAGLMQRAGFALPVVDHEVITVDYRSLRTLFSDLRALGETSVLTHAPRHYRSLAFFESAQELYAQQFANDDGTLPIKFEMIYLHGWAPHDSQQQPLKPGSAQTSLKEVL